MFGTIDATVLHTVFAAAGLSLPHDLSAERYPAERCYGALAAQAEPSAAQLGLDLAATLRLDEGALSLVRFVSEKAPTLRRAFTRLCRYATIVDTGIELTRHERAGRYHLRYANHCAVGRAVAAPLWLGVVYRTVRDASLQPCAPLEIHLRDDAPAPDTFAAFFDGAKVVDGAEHNALVFASALLDAPLASAEPTVARLLEDLAQQRLRALQPLHNDDALGVAMVEFLDEGAPMEQVCAYLGVTARTLQRRLKRAGTTYRGLLDDVRRAEAERDLKGTDTELADIATGLGYASADALSRACRRWFGVSAALFRAQR